MGWEAVITRTEHAFDENGVEYRSGVEILAEFLGTFTNAHGETSAYGHTAHTFYIDLEADDDDAARDGKIRSYLSSLANPEEVVMQTPAEDPAIGTRISLP